MILVFLAFLLGCFCVEVSGAPWRVGIRADDQALCVAQARFRAARGISGHVGRCVGSFEGVGWASHTVPSTCVPRRRMTLTGDATFRSRFGFFRVRSWR